MTADQTTERRYCLTHNGNLWMTGDHWPDVEHPCGYSIRDPATPCVPAVLVPVERREAEQAVIEAARRPGCFGCCGHHHRRQADRMGLRAALGGADPGGNELAEATCAHRGFHPAHAWTMPHFGGVQFWCRGILDIDHVVHACIVCAPDPSTPGPGCINCRRTGYDQTPCVGCPGDPQPTDCGNCGEPIKPDEAHSTAEIGVCDLIPADPQPTEPDPAPEPICDTCGEGDREVAPGVVDRVNRYDVGGSPWWWHTSCSTKARMEEQPRLMERLAAAVDVARTDRRPASDPDTQGESCTATLLDDQGTCHAPAEGEAFTVNGKWEPHCGRHLRTYESADRVRPLPPPDPDTQEPAENERISTKHSGWVHLDPDTQEAER